MCQYPSLFRWWATRSFRIYRCRDQYRAIHLRVNAETALHLEILDFGKGLTWEMYRLAEELKFLRRDIMVGQTHLHRVDILYAILFCAGSGTFWLIVFICVIQVAIRDAQSSPQTMSTLFTKQSTQSPAPA